MACWVGGFDTGLQTTLLTMKNKSWTYFVALLYNQFCVEGFFRRCLILLLQAEVKQAIESLCSYLPSELTGTCKAFVEQYGDKLVQLLLKQLDANKICQELGLCKAGIRSHVIPSLRVLTSHTIPILRPIDTLPMQPVTEGTFHVFYNKVNSAISELLHCLRHSNLKAHRICL